MLTAVSSYLTNSLCVSFVLCVNFILLATPLWPLSKAYGHVVMHTTLTEVSSYRTFLLFAFS